MPSSSLLRNVQAQAICRWRRAAAIVTATLLGSALTAVQAQTPIAVPVVSVQAQAVGQGFELDGTLQAVRQSTVSAQVPGRLMALAVKAGDKVRAGQLLATLDDREAQSGVQRSRAQIAQAQAELHNAQAQFDRAQKLRRQNFVSAAALDGAQAQLKAAQAAHDQANAGARQAGLSQGFTRITAPYDALVLQTHAEVGSLAMPGTPIVTIYAPAPVRAVVQVPLSRARQLGATPQIEVQLPGADGSLQWAKPTQSRPLPSADPISQTVEWRLELPAASAQYASVGQQLRVRFAAGHAQRTTVPASAVLRRGELTAVYVALDKGFALKAVRLGADHGAQGVEVLAGLSANDRVAVDPVRAGLQGAQPAAAQ